ncbi:hypothetical protein CRUP_010951 [Coryphaenoides rupestris]|nr:hypothetical protein CRUP_010951 [Coryphaenoides rupestris]
MDIRLALLLLCLSSNGITNAEVVEEEVPMAPLPTSNPIEATAGTPEPPAEGPATSVSPQENEDEDFGSGPCGEDSRDPRSLKVIANAIERIGLQLLENLEPTEEQPNVIISPVSISLALSQLALGAANETEELLMSHLHGNTLPCYHESLHYVLRQLKKNDLQIATRIFMRQGFELKQKFTEDSQRFYDSEPVALEGLAQVNSWVEQATNGKISDFLTSLPPNLLLMLINAVHFKGEWSARFDPRFTSRGAFHINENQMVDVDMMEAPKHPLSMYDDREMKARSRQVNVSTLAEKFNISGIYSRLPKENAVKVTMPKLKLEYTQALQDVFINLDGPLMVSSVMHKSCMELNEEGAEAAASTAVIISRASTPIFNLNHPFFFALVDDMTKVPILMGTVNNPNPGAPILQRAEAGSKDKVGYSITNPVAPPKGLPPK